MVGAIQIDCMFDFGKINAVCKSWKGKEMEIRFTDMSAIGLSQLIYDLCRIEEAYDVTETLFEQIEKDAREELRKRIGVTYDGSQRHDILCANADNFKVYTGGV